MLWTEPSGTAPPAKPPFVALSALASAASPVRFFSRVTRLEASIAQPIETVMFKGLAGGDFRSLRETSEIVMPRVAFSIQQHNINVDVLSATYMLTFMNSSQAKRYLSRRGCTFSPGRGGHLHVTCSDRKSVLPQHGGSKELGTGLWKKILKDLGLEEDE